MSDLVHRLRNWRESGEPPRATQELCDEAADALEARPGGIRAGDGNCEPSDKARIAHLEALVADREKSLRKLRERAACSRCATPADCSVLGCADRAAQTAASAVSVTAAQSLTDEWIDALRDDWSKEPGWAEFENSDFRRMVREIARAPAWQPIETAPTARGARFIGLTGSGRAVTAEPGWYVYDGPPVQRGWIEVERGSIVSVELVGWMPFPAPVTGEQP